MDIVIIGGLWIVICIIAAIVIRRILVFIAKRNGYCPDTMPMKYHMFGIGAYFTIIYPALYFLFQIF